MFSVYICSKLTLYMLAVSMLYVCVEPDVTFIGTSNLRMV